MASSLHVVPFPWSPHQTAFVPSWPSKPPPFLPSLPSEECTGITSVHLILTCPQLLCPCPFLYPAMQPQPSDASHCLLATPLQPSPAVPQEAPSHRPLAPRTAAGHSRGASHSGPRLPWGCPHGPTRPPCPEVASPPHSGSLRG